MNYFYFPSLVEDHQTCFFDPSGLKRQYLHSLNILVTMVTQLQTVMFIVFSRRELPRHNEHNEEDSVERAEKGRTTERNAHTHTHTLLS